MTNPNVHIYPGSREQRLLRLTNHLWEHLTPQQRNDLRPGIEQSDMGWALPQLDRLHENTWLTLDELATETGMSRKGIINWHNRYGLKPVNNRYRWGDIQNIRRARNQAKLGPKQDS